MVEALVRAVDGVVAVVVVVVVGVVVVVVGVVSGFGGFCIVDVVVAVEVVPNRFVSMHMLRASVACHDTGHSNNFVQQ